MLKAEQNRLGAISLGLRVSVERIIVILKEEKKRLDERPKSLAKQKENLVSVTGVGPVTTATFLADLPEPSKIARKKIAALVRRIPTNHVSGRKRSYRKTKGGRLAVRRALTWPP